MDDLSEHGQALLHPGEAGHSGGLKKAPKISAVQFGGAVANVANAAIGAGVLAFPFAFKSAGWIEGMVMSALFGVIMGSTLHVLGIATRETGKDAYQAVTQELLGKGFATAAQISMTFFCFGACCGYLDVIVDQVTPVLHQWVNPGSSILDRGWILLMFAPIVVSLCFVPRIEVLSFTSALAVLSIVYLTFVCLVQFSGDFTPAAIHEVTWFKLGASVFEAFPVICFALQCHLVFVPVTNGLLRTGGTVKTADRVALAAMLICLGLYIPTGAAGYLHFREATPSDVLTSMSDKSVLVLIARFGITATGMFSYPLLFFVGRSSLDDLLFGPRECCALSLISRLNADTSYVEQGVVLPRASVG